MQDTGAHHPDWLAQYEALTRGVAWVQLDRTQIELSGADRAAFLHNLCTNEVRRLEVGAGCEAFLTNVQGKTLGHVFVFACPETLIIDTVGGQGETILEHLDHYLISEDVTLADRSSEWSEWLLAGADCESLLGRMGVDAVSQAPLSHAPVELAGARAWLRRAAMTSAGGFLISARGEDAQAIADSLSAAGAVAASDAAFQAARIELGFPLFGVDVSDKNLPQEVARDEVAISFVKGCYLGQETVARIDALGHVNRLLTGLRFADHEIPEAGTELRADEHVVGQVTSATYSPRLAAPLALGYVRRGQHEPGTRLASSAGSVEVVALPVELARAR